MIYYKRFADVSDHKSETERARELLLYGCRKEYGIHTLPTVLYNEFGKPYFHERGDIHFNYSHCRSRAACVIDTEETGIDLEVFRPLTTKFIKRICHPREWEILRDEEDIQRIAIMLWTMKEAYVKYRGTGIRERMSAIDFSDLLVNGGNGCIYGIVMRVFSIEDGYLSVCTVNENYNQYVAVEEGL